MKIASRPGRLLVSLLLLVLSFTAPAAERTVYFVNDAQGSPVAAMDQQGEVLWRESYAPYGERRTKAADNNGKPAYTGKPEDADTSLVYMHARMYDPETARFTGIDPQGFKEDFPQSFGRYLYANNAPYVYVDPDGELPFLIPVAVFIAKEGAGVAFESATGVPAFFSMKGLSKAVAEAGKSMAARSAKKSIGNVSGKADGREAIVIGEGMDDRVIPTARANDAKWYIPPDADPKDWMNNNKRWINEKMDQGCRILDCGAAPGRKNYPDATSRYYKMELDQIKQRGYSLYEKIKSVGE